MMMLMMITSNNRYRLEPKIAWQFLLCKKTPVRAYKISLKILEFTQLSLNTMRQRIVSSTPIFFFLDF